jgi:hypothetical protein
LRLELASGCEPTRQLAFQHDDIITLPQRDLTNTAAQRLFVLCLFASRTVLLIAVSWPGHF